MSAWNKNLEDNVSDNNNVPNVFTAALLLVTGVMHSTVAPLMYFSALKHVLAQHAAILGYIEPLAAIPLAFLFLSEKPPFAALLGGVLILISGYLVVRQRARRETVS